MAKNKEKKQYSYNQRAMYHKNKIRWFGSKFYNDKTSSYDFDAYDKALDKSTRIQYSDGFTFFDNNIGYKDLDKHLNGKSKSFKKGYYAAKNAFYRAKKTKF